MHDGLGKRDIPFETPRLEVQEQDLPVVFIRRPYYDKAMKSRRVNRLKTMELARGIEPPICGLQISFRGIAEVLDRSGNPPSSYSVQPLSYLFLFVALCLHSA
jgi:hypothetical protein